ncbi:MAG: N-acetylmuramoyl-L-alanine amidase [Clostridia bacterium]|nr:N-acetylmuramoyl-L-alanine amidase [Clostridia bacterium]
MKRREALSPSLGLMATVTVLMLATLLLFYLVTGSAGRQKSMQVISDVHKTVVIDAGHGGIDGGAVAPDGTLEKHINLEIARILSALLRVSGYETVMTRESDVMLDTGNGSGRAKMRDLKQRLMIAGSYQGALTVSIHCNKFPLEKCKGMQVYYSANAVAEQTARAVQNEFLRLDSTCVR